MLVVCPMTLMSSAWGNDIETFAPTLTYSLADAKNRVAAFELATDVVIINTDGVKWLAKEGAKYLKQFDHLVIDEITTFKHPSSQRSKAMLKVSKAFTHRYGMTGTPNPRSVTELFHPALIIDGGARLGRSFYQFRSQVQAPTQIGPSANHLRWDDKPGAEQAVYAKLADITIRYAFEDVMTHVPPNYRHIKSFDLSAKTLRVYKQMEDDLIIALEDKIVSAVHAASLRSKLLQIASGAVYDGGEDGSYKVIDTGRYELISELVEGKQHSLVFFRWAHQRDQLSKMFDKRGISFAVIDGKVNSRERSEIVSRYQDGQYQTLLIQPKTGAHGLTLTRGTTTIFASPIYEADLMKQALHRIYRGTQDKVTNTIFVEAKNTVEHAVFERMNGRYERMADLLDLMKTRR